MFNQPQHMKICQCYRDSNRIKDKAIWSSWQMQKKDLTKAQILSWLEKLNNLGREGITYITFIKDIYQKTYIVSYKMGNPSQQLPNSWPTETMHTKLFCFWYIKFGAKLIHNNRYLKIITIMIQDSRGRGGGEVMAAAIIVVVVVVLQMHLTLCRESKSQTGLAPLSMGFSRQKY